MHPSGWLHRSSVNCAELKTDGGTCTNSTFAAFCCATCSNSEEDCDLSLVVANDIVYKGAVLGSCSGTLVRDTTCKLACGEGYTLKGGKNGTAKCTQAGQLEIDLECLPTPEAKAPAGDGTS